MTTDETHNDDGNSKTKSFNGYFFCYYLLWMLIIKNDKMEENSRPQHPDTGISASQRQIIQGRIHCPCDDMTHYAAHAQYHIQILIRYDFTSVGVPCLLETATVNYFMLRGQRAACQCDLYQWFSTSWVSEPAFFSLSCMQPKFQTPLSIMSSKINYWNF